MPRGFHGPLPWPSMGISLSVLNLTQIRHVTNRAEHLNACVGEIWKVTIDYKGHFSAFKHATNKYSLISIVLISIILMMNNTYCSF